MDTDQASGDESESGSSVTLDMTEYEWEALKAKLKGHGSATGGHGSATGGQGPATGGQDPDTVFHAQPLRKRRLSADRRINALHCQLWRKNVKLEQLQQELAKYTRPKDLAKRVSEEWIIRVILTAPNVSARALSESFCMAVGEDHSGRQQPSISRLLVVISRLLVVY